MNGPRPPRRLASEVLLLVLEETHERRIAEALDRFDEEVEIYREFDVVGGRRMPPVAVYARGVEG